MTRNTLILMVIAIVVLIFLAFIFGGKKSSQQEPPRKFVTRPDFGTSQSRTNTQLLFSEDQDRYGIRIPDFQPGGIIVSPTAPKTSRQTITTEKTTVSPTGIGTYFNYGQVGSKSTPPNLTSPQFPSTVGDIFQNQPISLPGSEIGSPSEGIESEGKDSEAPLKKPETPVKTRSDDCAFKGGLLEWLICIGQ